jgi:plastocyanin
VKESITRRIFPGRRAQALLLGVVTLFLSAAAVGCGGNEQSKETPVEAPPPPNPNAKPVDPAMAGVISGIVKLDGMPPKMRGINMRSVPTCNQMHATPPLLEDVVPGNDGTLQNVVVYLKGDFSAYSFPENPDPVKIDQTGCQYVPHVVAVTTHTPVQIHNSDSATHNSTAITNANMPWNETQNVGSPAVQKVFTVPEISLALKCNIHPWMKMFVAVFSHPYFQVTGSDGSFTLKNVPPGSYTLSAWQEHYGTIEQPITVTAQGEQMVTLTFKASN